MFLLQSYGVKERETSFNEKAGIEAIYCNNSPLPPILF